MKTVKKVYSPLQKEILLLGQQEDTRFGRVDDLYPRSYTWVQMLYISLGRGTTRDFEDILLPKRKE